MKVHWKYQGEYFNKYLPIQISIAFIILIFVLPTFSFPLSILISIIVIIPVLLMVYFLFILPKSTHILKFDKYSPSANEKFKRIINKEYKTSNIIEKQDEITYVIRSDRDNKDSLFSARLKNNRELSFFPHTFEDKLLILKIKYLLETN